MSVEYERVCYSDAVVDAYRKLHPEQNDAIERGKLEWKLRNCPGGPGAVMIARSQGEIVGMNAFMPSRFRVGAEQVRAYQSMDTIVTPAARAKGVFVRLSTLFYESADAALIYGFPNAHSAPGFFGKLGWTHLSAVPMLVRPLRTGYFARRVSRFLPDLPLPHLARATQDPGRIERFDERTSALWRRFSAGIDCAVERDAEFLNWRLVDHPSERYTIVGDGDEAFAAWSVTHKHGARIGYLAEAIGVETAPLAGLIASALCEMRAAGAELAFAWCLPWSPNYRAYRKAGFYPLPEMLRPIAIQFGARPLLEPAAAQIATRRGWYISYLDSDTV
ncbi:MAG TPA: GNAT family N-acetyltransferase [Allosphingosinicella sp.]|jgi:hypothetical protein